MMRNKRKKLVDGSKIANKPCLVDGIRFHSRKEARRYRELMLLQKAGLISNLILQPKYKLAVGNRPILLKSDRYKNGRQVTAIMDFAYIDEGGQEVVEDVKGIDTPISRLKRAIVEAQYGVVVRIV